MANIKVMITFNEKGEQKFKPFERLISRGDVRVLSEDEWNLNLVLVENKDLEVIFEDDLLVITKGLSQLYTAEGVQAVAFRIF